MAASPFSGIHLARAKQVGEGVSPTLDAKVDVPRSVARIQEFLQHSWFRQQISSISIDRAEAMLDGSEHQTNRATQHSHREQYIDFLIIWINPARATARKRSAQFRFLGFEIGYRGTFRIRRTVDDPHRPSPWSS
jgi:hypothetical protein